MPIQTTYGTRMQIGLVGGLADALNDGRNIHPMINTEASALIPFGNAVKLSGAAVVDGTRADNQRVLLPVANTDKVFGIALHSHVTNADVVAGIVDGVKTGNLFNVLRRGRVYAKPEASSGVIPGARLYVRAVAGVGEALGALRGSADSTDTIDCTAQGQWLTAPDVDGIAELEVDFVNI